MFSDPYIEALLVDEELADLVWDLWYQTKITNEVAELAWWLVQCETETFPKSRN